MSPFIAAIVGAGVQLASNPGAVKQHVKNSPVSTGISAVSASGFGSLLMYFYTNPPESGFQQAIAITGLVISGAISLVSFLYPGKRL